MYNRQPIRSDDENAIEKLSEKVKALRGEQEDMKKANKHFREFNTMQGYNNLTEAEAKAWDERINSRKFNNSQPYPNWQLQNNYQNLRATEKRLKSLEREESSEVSENSYDTEKHGFEVIEDKTAMRLKLAFDGKPNATIRDKLKSSGFKWSPTNECWQRLLNDNARYAVRRLLEFFNSRLNKAEMEM